MVDVVEEDVSRFEDRDEMWGFILKALADNTTKSLELYNKGEKRFARRWLVERDDSAFDFAVRKQDGTIVRKKKKKKKR